MTAKAPPAPKGTGARGRRLWRAVVEAWELEQHEIELLVEIIRTIDALDRLEAIVARDGDVVDVPRSGPRAHPALVEARQMRIALARMTAALRLPDGAEGDESKGRRQRRVGVRGVYGLRVTG